MMDHINKLEKKLSESEDVAGSDVFEDREKHSSDEGILVEIDYQSCSWQRTAGLLFSEYICLAILSFPWSYSVLGLVPGLILTVFVALSVLYTGLIISDYCNKYPEIQNVCDIGQNLFWNSRWAWYATAFCFLLNNLLIQGLHVLVGAKYLNTITNHSECTVVFSVIAAIICFVCTLPRTFASMSLIGVFSALTMFIAVLLTMIFAGIQDHPFGYVDTTPVKWNLWPEKGTTYVSGMSAFLNIVYTFVGQITYPSFIAEMKRPQDFKKALYVVTLCELITFALAGSIVYVYVGNAYITAPAFGSLSGAYKKIAFSFAIPTLIFLGALYANVSSQFLFFNIFKQGSRHASTHTKTGWATWIGINIVLWVLAFIVAEVIPFFSDLLSLMSSLFDCWFGFVFWGVAFIRLKQVKYGDNWLHELTFLDKVNLFLCVSLIAIGIYILGPGLYASVDSIVLSYQSNAYGSVFTCESNGL